MKSASSAIALETPKQSLFRNIVQMMKPRITTLVVITTLPGLLMGEALPGFILVATTFLGTALLASSAGILNQIIEATTDQQMERTKDRPIVIGSISPLFAVFFSALLAIVGFSTLFYIANPITAFLALSAHIFYVLGYTLYLKPNTTQNIVIGGAAGAIGPLIGCAAATGTVSPGAWTLFAIIFFWTPPHFWALALNYKDDYRRADIPMLPVIKGDEITRRSIFRYTFWLFPLTIALPLTNTISWAATAFLLSLSYVFTKKANQLYRTKDNELAMGVFRFSCWYLLFYFLIVTFDQLIF